MFKNIYVEVLETKLHQCEKFTDALKNPPPQYLLVKSSWIYWVVD